MSDIEEIKNKLNVLDVVGGYMKLAKAGINYRGICPFHSEKTPSFFVSPTRQTWHCFGCGAGSSIFDFVMKIEGIEFGDALRILANKAGVELKRENIQLRTERQRFYEICDLACLFFEKQLERGIGKEAEEYLLKRGILKESIKKWRLGYSPDTWGSLTDFLIGRGYGREEIIKAGLAIEKEGNKNDSYDRFRGRIIFPVFNLNNQVVGFGGRVFKQADNDEIAKYINTPQTLLYDKGNLLYGLNNAKMAIRKQNQCVVTEGYTDVIMCHQAGFENTVAASGTALTFGQLNILKRYSENLVLAFDADMAGDSATKRGINVAQEQGFNIKIIGNYLKDSDPADIVLGDPKQWKKYVSEARSIMDYYFDSAFSIYDNNSPEGKKEIGKIILPTIKHLQSKIEQSYWVQKLSGALNIKEEAVLEELLKIKDGRTFQAGGPTQIATRIIAGEPEEKISNYISADSSTNQRKKLIEEKIISLIIKNPDYINMADESLNSFFSEKVRPFLEEVRKLESSATNFQKDANVYSEQVIQKDSLQTGNQFADEVQLKNNLKEALGVKISELELDTEWKNFLAALALKSEVEYAEDGKEEFELCLLQLKNIELKDRLAKISEDIKKAESEKNSEKVNNLVDEFNKLTKEL